MIIIVVVVVVIGCISQPVSSFSSQMFPWRCTKKRVTFTCGYLLSLLYYRCSSWNRFYWFYSDIG